MIILSTTNDKLQVVLDAAHTSAALKCSASFRDRTSTTFTPNRTVTDTNGTTDVDLVAAPAASTQRIVDFISVYNSDTGAKTVTIKYDISGTEYIIFKASIGVGEMLQYAEGMGWTVYANSGAIKQSINQGNNATNSSMNTVVLGSDVTNNNAVANSIADVTGLSFAVTAGNTYWFRFFIQYTAAATTTGSRWTINGPSITELRYCSEYSLTTTSRTFNEGLSAYDTPAASNASSAATGSNIAIVEGIIKTSANGTVIARFASEVSSSAIVAKAGSMLCYQQIA